MYVFVFAGIVSGGGTALLRCLPTLDGLETSNSDQQRGVEIVRHALKQPCFQVSRVPKYFFSLMPNLTHTV